jgi:hypothetical protein
MKKRTFIKIASAISVAFTISPGTTLANRSINHTKISSPNNYPKGLVAYNDWLISPIDKRSLVEKELTKVKNSKSWKLTQPLKTIKSWLK